MSVTTSEAVTDDEPCGAHDARCAIWTTTDRPCDCRDTEGHATALDGRDIADPIATRAEFEARWARLTLCQRAEELDLITRGHRS